jgi:2-amino-4-hydroxy-6-hydroxymethyldihydropteridine diphosphokinase
MPTAVAFVGVGANLGDAVRTVRQALAELNGLTVTQLHRHSSLYRSAPIDSSGPAYVNAVAELTTLLEPQALLDALQVIELRHGRARPYRNAPRTLDLDLLLYGELRLQTPQLTLPHPRLHRRAFVLEPLLELEPNLRAPGLGALNDYLAAVGDQPVARILP